MPYKKSFGHYYDDDRDDDAYFELHPQSAFPSFEEITAQIRDGDRWQDNTDLNFIPDPVTKEIPVLKWPEELSKWTEGTTPRWTKFGEDDAKQYAASDIQQGRLGDGWLMAAFASAVHTGRISQMLRRLDEEKGVYEFRFYNWARVEGSDLYCWEPVLVCVDSRLPVLPSEPLVPAYGYSDEGGELWPSLLEKAYAKVIKLKRRNNTTGFAALNGGWPCIGLAHMLGGQANSYDVLPRLSNSDIEEARMELTRWKSSGQLITVSFKEADSGAEVVGPQGKIKKGNDGLLTAHSYSVFLINDCKTHTLVQLRNPFGKRAVGNKLDAEWKGDWCDESPLWQKYPEVQRMCHWEPSSDGLFYMDFTDFIRNVHKFHVFAPCLTLCKSVGKSSMRMKIGQLHGTASESAIRRQGDYFSHEYYYNEDHEPIITLWEPSHWETYEDILDSIPYGNRWLDPTVLDMPEDPQMGTPQLVFPEEVPHWNGMQPVFLRNFEHGIQADAAQIEQGYLEDGWFLASVVDICQRNRLDEVITRWDEGKGVYEFRFWKFSRARGFLPVHVCVDSRVPLFQNGQSRPAYAHAFSSGELWPSLLEKAFAKAIKTRKDDATGYSAMQGGLTCVAYSHLVKGPSGMHHVIRREVPPEVVSDEIVTKFQNGEYIVVGFKEAFGGVMTEGIKPGSSAVRGNHGLIARHPYGLTQCKTIHANDGKRLYLMQFRNPYGAADAGNTDHEWRGHWTDKSKLWDQYPEAREECQPTMQRDGLFWMSLEDVAEQIDYYQNCHPSSRQETGPAVDLDALRRRLHELEAGNQDLSAKLNHMDGSNEALRAQLNHLDHDSALLQASMPSHHGALQGAINHESAIRNELLAELRELDVDDDGGKDPLVEFPINRGTRKEPRSWVELEVVPIHGPPKVKSEGTTGLVKKGEVLTGAIPIKEAKSMTRTANWARPQPAPTPAAPMSQWSPPPAVRRQHPPPTTNYYPGPMHPRPY